MAVVTLPAKSPVLFDHDGGVDDFLSLLLLLSMPEIDLLGVSITPADCYAENALETTLKLLLLRHRLNDVPVSVGNYHGINAFPAEWRAQPRMLNALPSLINLDLATAQVDPRRSPEFIRDTLAAAATPVTVLMTGPCSNLVQALALAPELASRIKEVVWMGGAVDVIGNVRAYNHNGSAEWNVFWDPEGAHQLLTYHLPLTLIPLDVTNHVPVDIEFLQTLARQAEHPFANLAGQFWATTVATIPSYEYTYFMWDVLATSYLAIPEAFVVEEMELEIAPTGPNAGQTYRQPGSRQWVRVAKQVDKPTFYGYLLGQLREGIFPAFV